MVYSIYIVVTIYSFMIYEFLILVINPINTVNSYTFVICILSFIKSGYYITLVTTGFMGF